MKRTFAAIVAAMSIAAVTACSSGGSGSPDGDAVKAPASSSASDVFSSSDDLSAVMDTGALLTVNLSMPSGVDAYMSKHGYHTAVMSIDNTQSDEDVTVGQVEVSAEDGSTVEFTTGDDLAANSDVMDDAPKSSDALTNSQVMRGAEGEVYLYTKDDVPDSLRHVVMRDFSTVGGTELEPAAD